MRYLIQATYFHLHRIIITGLLKVLFRMMQCLTVNDLLFLDKRIINWKPGNKLIFNAGIPLVTKESDINTNIPDQAYSSKHLLN